MRRDRWLLALLLLAIVAVATVAIFPLPKLYNRMPPLDFAKLTGYRLGSALAMLVVYLGCFAFYAWALAETVAGRGPGRRLIIGGSLLWTGILAWSYPFGAIDIFIYGLYSRLWLFHGANPFIYPPAYAAADPWLPLAGEWSHVPTSYGPLWELLALLPARLAGPDHFLWQVIGLKATVWLLLAAILFLLDRILAEVWSDRREVGLLLFAWNPLVLLMFGVDGHNDLLMLLFLLCSWWAAHQRRWTWAAVSLWLSALSKLIPLFLWPFLFLLAWREEKTSFRRRWLVLNAALALLWGAILWLLIHEAPGQWALLHQDYATMSVSAMLILLGRRFLPGVAVFRPVMNGLHLAFGIAYVWLLWRFWRGKISLVAAWLAVLAALLFLFTNSFRPWYATWLLVLVPFCRRLAWRDAILFFSFTVLTVTVYFWDVRYLLHWPVWIVYLLSIPYIFILPLLLSYFLSKRAECVASARRGLFSG